MLFFTFQFHIFFGSMNTLWPNKYGHGFQVRENKLLSFLFKNEILKFQIFQSRGFTKIFDILINIFFKTFHMGIG